jgi:uncharacterized sulfatase
MRFLPALIVSMTATAVAHADSRPNIVWIVTEDISPSLGCYGDRDAITPNLDKFAAQGARFTNAFTHCPVCAPTRSGLITGQYPITIGSHHMRSKLIKPPGLFVDELRKAGYATFWPGKTDFNFDLPKDWCDTRDWTKSPDLLPKDKPFFAYVNFTVTHESQVRANPQQYAKNTARLTAAQKRDPAKVQLPPYYPDAPEVRRNVANYHDNITAMDYLVGDVLKTLDDRKLTDNTVVIFFGDHGWGLSRGKRWCYDSGTRAPLLVRWPGKITPGTVSDELIAFLDITASTVAITGAKIPDRFQGQDFLTANKAKPRDFVFSFRDRMDETYDRIRSARSKQYRFIKNFHPELPYAQWINYMDEMPTMKVWRQQAFAGKLNPVQMAFFAKTKPPEELYDIVADPHETKNLAADPAHAAALKRHREATEQWIADAKDLGAVPEKELIARGLVKDMLSAEYDARVKLHPKTSPVP